MLFVICSFVPRAAPVHGGSATQRNLCNLSCQSGQRSPSWSPFLTTRRPDATGDLQFCTKNRSRARGWGRLRATLGPSWAILDHLGTILGPSWAILGHLGTILGPSWANLGHLGTILGPCWAISGLQASPEKHRASFRLLPRFSGIYIYIYGSLSESYVR